METHLLVIPGTDHDETIFTREHLVWDDGRVRGAMSRTLCSSDEVVRCNVC